MKKTLGTTLMGFALSIQLGACSDASTARQATEATTSPGTAIENSGARDPDKMAKLRRYSDGGCGVSARDAAGAMRGFAIQRADLPFPVPAVHLDPRTGRGNGQVVQVTVKRQHGGAVLFNCWVPNTVSSADLARLVESSRSRRWQSIFDRLARARVIPENASQQPLSDEAKVFEAEVLAPASAQQLGSTSARFNGLCVLIETKLSLWDDENGGWSVEIVFIEGCGGGWDVFGYIIDNGYDDIPHVVVDADSYEITTGDSVTFVAQIVSDVHLSPIGWQWTPANGYPSDPWTVACAGTATTCNKVEIHGTGTMAYTVQDAGGNDIIGRVRIIADLPPDIGSLGDDGDAPGTSTSNTPVTTVALSVGEAASVLATAKASGEWTYTQGCAHCSTPHGIVNGAINSEYPIDYSLRRGDCTDLVFYSNKTYLGTTAWPFEKISTTQFNTWADTAPTRLARHGYTQITDSTQVRPGDAVLRTSVSGGGHAGIFMMWGANWVPIAHANNGSPADSIKAGLDTTTGRWTAQKAPGKVIKYFRALKVVP